MLMMVNLVDALCRIIQMLKDEHQALQLAFTALEDKCQTKQDEFNELLKRWMQLKAKDANVLNEENSVFMKLVCFLSLAGAVF